MWKEEKQCFTFSLARVPQCKAFKLQEKRYVQGVNLVELSGTYFGGGGEDKKLHNIKSASHSISFVSMV